MDQATLNQLPGMPQSTLTGSSSAAAQQAAGTPEVAGTASPFHTMSGAEDDDAGSDSGQLFSTDSLAAAAASLVAQQQQQQQQYGGSSGVPTSLGLGKSPVKGRSSSGEESPGVSQQVSGLWVAGDSQVTRLTLLWTKEAGGAGATDATAMMDQEVSKTPETHRTGWAP
jgi:hypothetical protein